MLPRALFLVILFATQAAAQTDRDAQLKVAYDRMDAYIMREMRAKNIPGLSLALTDRNRLVRASTYGYADRKLKKPITETTEFEIGSISKSFTSISLLQLTEQGKFDLRQPITAYLPWFSIHSNYAPITSHDVMSHTAGLPRDRDDIPSSLYQAAGVRDRWTGYEPGKHFAYSNIGYQIMGYLLEEITGKSSGENVRERILQPLGMTHSQPVFTHDTYARLATGYSPLYDDRPTNSSTPLIEATGSNMLAVTAPSSQPRLIWPPTCACCSTVGLRQTPASSPRRAFRYSPSTLPKKAKISGTATA
jgi:CubicO group peptidase (beta-lactamase class C family)